MESRNPSLSFTTFITLSFFIAAHLQVLTHTHTPLSVLWTVSMPQKRSSGEQNINRKRQEQHISVTYLNYSLQDFLVFKVLKLEKRLK